ncbi:hypothetical protein [Cryobacterium sp. Sr3]|uniref:hypothetical protein n=1 Tax=Cryobacterium sp. Sr3 TaxID=1259194 RepID=UPI00106DA96D|nr:hypothetical protein [Cryobacterium sp. Sr3]TFB59128.1 hypothetical protein E3N94_03755 [Cryobacterium sp. Sr3]
MSSRTGSDLVTFGRFRKVWRAISTARGGRSRPHVAASSAEQVVTSDAFATAWEEALRLSQTQVIAALQAASYADRIILLADGRVVDDRGRSTAEQISTMLPSMEARSAW